MIKNIMPLDTKCPVCGVEHGVFVWGEEWSDEYRGYFVANCINCNMVSDIFWFKSENKYAHEYLTKEKAIDGLITFIKYGCYYVNKIVVDASLFVSKIDNYDIQDESTKQSLHNFQTVLTFDLSKYEADHYEYYKELHIYLSKPMPTEIAVSFSDMPQLFKVSEKYLRLSTYVHPNVAGQFHIDIEKSIFIAINNIDYISY